MAQQPMLPIWPMPAESTSVVGLGGGLAWSIDPALCPSLVDRFGAENFDYFGVRIFSFVTCEEITDALLRGFSSWSANHGRVSFFDVSSACAARGLNATACDLAEVAITGGATPPGQPLRVSVQSADETIRRATLTFDTEDEGACYYMDATVCEACEEMLEDPLSADVHAIASRHGLRVDSRFKGVEARRALADAMTDVEARVRAGESLRFMCW